MKNWEKLEPDKYNLVTTHFTPGRGGHKIRHITLHHMAMIGNVDDCVRVWRDRPASAHYCIDRFGNIGQAVNDWDTAWSNANLLSNQESITIEHSNCGGPGDDWPISAETREAGAHLVAALCHAYGLGRPVSGKNVRFHSVESGGITSCPYHLRPGHKYHDAYFARAQWWFDKMAGVQVENGRKGLPMTVEKDVSLILDQLVGPGRKADGSPAFNGWNEESIRAAAETRPGGGKTIAEMIALARDDIAQVKAVEQSHSASINNLIDAVEALSKLVAKAVNVDA